MFRSTVVRQNVQGLLDLLTTHSPNLALPELTDEEDYDDEEEDGGWSDMDQTQEESTIDTDFSQLSDNETEPNDLVSFFYFLYNTPL